MKTCILSMLALFTTAVYAQKQIEIRYPYPEWEVYQNKPKGEKHHVSIYSKTRKDKRLEKMFSFNNKGLIEQETLFKKNSGVSNVTSISYNDSNRVTSKRIMKNNKVRHLYVYDYTNLTSLTRTKSFYKDTLKPIRTTEYEYTPVNKYKSITTYNENMMPIFRYEYEYYDNGSRKSSRYFHKGKMKHAWVFDCDWKGELDNTKTVKICKNRTYEADSSFTEIFENNFKGKVSKTIVKSTADGRVLENSMYDAKGNLKLKTVYQYNVANKLVKYLVYKNNSNQPQSIELFEYDHDASLIASIRLDRNGDVKSRKEFAYN